MSLAMLTIRNSAALTIPDGGAGTASSNERGYATLMAKALVLAGKCPK